VIFSRGIPGYAVSHKNVSSSSYPFELVQLNTCALANRSRLELFRQGVDEDVVLLHLSKK
jgi:hypothetical protein